MLSIGFQAHCPFVLALDNPNRIWGGSRPKVQGNTTTAGMQNADGGILSLTSEAGTDSDSDRNELANSDDSQNGGRHKGPAKDAKEVTYMVKRNGMREPLDASKVRIFEYMHIFRLRMENTGWKVLPF